MAAVLILRTPAHIMATEGDNGCVQQACLVGYALCVYGSESLPSGHLAETGDVYCKSWLGCMLLAVWKETAWVRKCGSARLCISSVWLSEAIGYLVESMRDVAGLSRVFGTKFLSLSVSRSLHSKTLFPTTLE
jgi:hypothetical protein